MFATNYYPKDTDISANGKRRTDAESTYCNRIGQNVFLSEDVVLGKDLTIGNNVTVYPGVRIGDRCTIFDGAVLGRPPLSAGNTTRPLDKLSGPLTIGPGTIIGANAVLY